MSATTSLCSARDGELSTCRWEASPAFVLTYVLTCLPHLTCVCACILRTHLRTYLLTWILQLRKPRISFYVLTYLRGSWILQLRKPRKSFYVLTYLRGFFGHAVSSTIRTSLFSRPRRRVLC